MYSEEQVLKKVSTKKQKQIITIIIGISALLILILGVSLYLYIASRPKINLPLVSLSTEEWTSESITLTVNNDPTKIDSYSFDGGVTWQTNNTYIVTENGEVTVQVMDTKGKLSKKSIVYINNIDREPPIMIFESSTTIQRGSNFSVRTGVQITDKESGLSNDYTVVPNKIDASVEGEYTLIYSAFDKAGNSIEKSRTIIVKDIIGRTYYRYRTATINTSQCEPYLCKCVTSQSAKESGTCPTGYSINDERQCCQTCYNTCKETVWSEWSEWSQEKVTATSKIEVETMIKED